MKKILTFLILLTLAIPCRAAVDTFTDSIAVKRTWLNGFAWTGHVPKDRAFRWAKEVEDRIDGTTSTTNMYFTPTDTEPTVSEGRVYYDLSEHKLKFRNATDWVAIEAGSSGNSLDGAYDVGSAITVDGDAVTLTVSALANNAALSIAQNDATNDPDGILITMAASSDGNALNINGVTSGTDINADNWSMTTAGVMTWANAETIDNATDDKFEFHSNDKEDFTLDLSGTNIINFSSDTAAVTLEFNALDKFTGVESITGDAGADFALSTTNSGTFNFTIAQAGSGDNELRLTSAGTAANAIALTASTGGVTVTAVDDIILTCASSTGGDDLVIQQTGAFNASVLIIAAGTGTDAISLQATAGAIDIDAIGADAGDLTMNAADNMTIVAADGLTLTGTVTSALSSAALTLGSATTTASTVLQSGTGDLALTSTDDITLTTNTTTTDNITITNTPGTATTAIVVLATAGGVEIDAAAAKILALDGGTVAITSKTAGAGAISLTTNIGASETILVTNTSGTGAGAIALTATAGGITAKVPDGKDLKIGNTALDAYLVVAAGTAGNEDVRLVNTNGTDEKAIELTATAGGVDINAAAGKNITINGGQILIEAEENAASAISLITNTGTSETIVITNTLGIAAGAIAIDAAAGGVTIDTIAGAAGDITVTVGDDITFTVAGDYIITNTGPFTVSGASTLTGAVTCTAGIQMGAISREATANGTGTGTIATGTSFVTAVDATQTTDWMFLPAPVAGTIVWIGTVDDASGFEVRTNDPTNISMNGVVGAGVETAIPSTASLLRFVCISSNDWIGTMWDASGTEAETPTPDT